MTVYIDSSLSRNPTTYLAALLCLETVSSLDNEMVRATIVVAVDEPEEVAAVDVWFTKWTGKLTHLSDNSGCGCCVNIWDIDGPQEAVADIPSSANAASEWAGGK